MKWLTSWNSFYCYKCNDAPAIYAYEIWLWSCTLVPVTNLGFSPVPPYKMLFLIPSKPRIMLSSIMSDVFVLEVCLYLCDWRGVKTDWIWIKKAGITGLGPAAPPSHPQKGFPQHFHTTSTTRRAQNVLDEAEVLQPPSVQSQHSGLQEHWKKGHDVELGMDSTTPSHTCGRQLDRSTAGAELLPRLKFGTTHLHYAIL